MEFQEVMKQFDRMCKTNAGCFDCPLHEQDGVSDRCSIGAFVNDSKRIEREIMAWAVEHPENVKQSEEQEPRLMTMEEAVSAEVVYYEERYVHHAVTKGQSVFPVIRCVDGFSHTVEWYSPYFPEGKAHILFAPDEYGIFGRCWTSRPTDEQREAESWNE